MKLQIRVDENGRHLAGARRVWILGGSYACRRHFRCQVQDVWLRIGHCLVVVHDRARQGHDSRTGRQREEHRDCQGALPASRQTCVLIMVACCCEIILLTRVSVHCSLLAEDAIKSAIKDYQGKREKRLAMAAVCLAPQNLPLPKCSCFAGRRRTDRRCSDHGHSLTVGLCEMPAEKALCAGNV